MNKVILIGRLARDPELRYTAGSNIAVCQVQIAVDRRFKSENQPTADFIPIVAWRQQAEFISKYFTKGSRIALVGSIQVRPYEDKDGQKRYATEVVVDEAYFTQDKPKASGNGNSASNSMPYADEGATGANDNYFTIDGDDDVPF
jgi:single-strand DNA-binding protein